MALNTFDSENSLELSAVSAVPAGAVRISLAGGEKSGLLQEKGDFQLNFGEKEKTVVFYLGEKISADTYRSIGGLIARWLRKTKLDAAHLDIPEDLNELEVSQLFEGLLLGGFVFDKYKQKKSEHSTALTVNESFSQVLARVKTVCEAVNMARDWAHEPASAINPETLSERAVQLAEKYGLTCTVIDDVALRAMGAGAIVAVGQGSKTPSKMIILEYPGDGSGNPVVLVGKAITFDSGGYSIKPADSMVGMKYDKCGAMTVLGALRAAAGLKLATPLVGVICAAENMLSKNSYRPDDILISLSGKSIEVVSTDAEGRLVLADGLTYAQKEYKPKAIIDLATLTGGCVVAYGHVRAGVLSNNDELFNALYKSGEKTWERVWRLPHDDDYAKLLKGKDGDIKNSGGRHGSPVTGGMFLKEFVSDDIPWAHIDIAGVADLDDGNDISIPGATGFGIRLLLDWLQKKE